MANLFDRNNYPTQEPDLLVVGDRWMWRRPDLVADYPTADYALTYEFHEDSGGDGSHKFTLQQQKQQPIILSRSQVRQQQATTQVNTTGMRLLLGHQTAKE